MPKDLRSATCALAHNISHTTTDHFRIHSHPFYELYYFLSGDVHFIYGGTEYIMQPHTLAVIAPNVFHGIHVLSAETYERITFHFTEESISLPHRQLLMGGLPTEETVRGGTSPMPCIISHADSLGILPLMLDAERIIGMPQDVCDAMASIMLEAILGQLLIHEGDLRSLSTASYYSDCQDIKPVLSYIHQNLTKKITLDDLSDSAHVSKSKLNQLFRTHLGVTAMEYVIQRRLSYAQQLLVSGCTAAQAGFASGFGDYANFYRAYVRQMGHSPIHDKRTVSESPVSSDFVELSPDLQRCSDQNICSEKVPDIWSLHKAMVIGTPGALIGS